MRGGLFICYITTLHPLYCTTSDTLYCCTLQDVFKPEPPRLRRHLSAVVNLAKFREEKLAAFQVAASDVLPGGCF